MTNEKIAMTRCACDLISQKDGILLEKVTFSFFLPMVTHSILQERDESGEGAECHDGVFRAFHGATDFPCSPWCLRENGRHLEQCVPFIVDVP